MVSKTPTLKTIKTMKGSNEEGIMINQYITLKKLGKGKFATVYLCKDSKTSEMFAIKKMNKKKLKYEQAGGGKTGYDCVKEELKNLQKLDHPNIIWL